MTTTTITGQIISFTGGAPSAVGAVTMTSTFLDDVSGISYSVLADHTPSSLDLIDLSPAAYDTSFTAGADISNMLVYFGVINWTDGGIAKSSTVLAFVDNGGGNINYFDIDGDPLPTFATAADVGAWHGSVTGFADATGSFATGATIPFSSIPGMASTEVDTINGTSGNDQGAAILSGGSGDDLIYGLGGDDDLSGGAGDDYMDGGAGSGDCATYIGATGGVQVYLNLGLSTGAWGNDTLLNFEIAEGSNFDDRIVGNATGTDLLLGADGNDIIKTKGGDDTVYGGDGDDKIIGDAGDEIFYGGDGGDIAIGNSGTDTIYGQGGNDFLYGGRDADYVSGGAGNDTVKGNLGNDVLEGGAQNDRLYGGGGSDSLDGGTGKDYLFGENGVDGLYGGLGNDSMTGGGGADTFVYKSGATEGYDRIKDFEDGIDKIDLSDFAYAGFADVSALASEIAAGVKLNFGGGNVLLLEGMLLADFDASDVLL